MFNILTIDLEDYFQVHAFSRVIRFEDWGKFECRIERNTDRLLSILNDSPIRNCSTAAQLHCSTSTHDHSSTSALKNNSEPSPHYLNLSPNASRLAKDYLASSPCAMRSAPCGSPKGTFFILGWIAERYPGLVRRIQKEGHEIACHGYAHQLVYTQSRDEFRQDVKRAKSILEDITGSEVIGYRAPSYSITNKSQWAFEVLVEEGFKYDSSIFPIRHDFYGMPDAPRFPFAISLDGSQNVEFLVLNYELNTTQNSKLITQNSQLITQNSKIEINNSLTHSLINTGSDNSTFNVQNSTFISEFPISTVKVFGQNFPISGGGYFRLLPYSIIRKAFRSINEKEQKPFIFYMHPWEIDPEQPRVSGLSFRSKFRHYVNLNKTESRFRKLLEDFQFSTIRQVLIQNS